MDKEQNTEIVETKEQVPTDETRRKLAKAALATPIVASVASRSAWAAKNGIAEICTVSGMQSGNVSNMTKECRGAGCTPGYWKNNPGTWLMETPFNPGICAKWKGNSCSEWNTEGGDTFIDVFGIPSVLDLEQGTYAQIINPDGSITIEQHGDTPMTLMGILQRGKITGSGQDEVMVFDETGSTGIQGNAVTQEFHYIAAILNGSNSYYGSDWRYIVNAVRFVRGFPPKTFPDSDEGEFDFDKQDVDEQQLFELLVKMNQGQDACPFNAHGFCDDTRKTHNGYTCIPACENGERWDYCTISTSSDPLSSGCVPQKTARTEEEVLLNPCICNEDGKTELVPETGECEEPKSSTP